MYPFGKQFKHLYKVSIKWDINEQENALCEMPLNACALFISYMINNYMYIYKINKLIKYKIRKQIQKSTMMGF